MMATMRSLLTALILLPALAMAEAPCAGEGDPFIERPGFGAATPLPTAEALALSRRDGGTLVLQGELGPIRLADHPACAESSDHVDCVTHRLVAAFAAPRGYLVQRQHYEHADHLWVDAIQGQRESVAHLPRFSASLGWMVSVPPATYAALNGIEVFDLSRGGVIRTWQHVPRQGVERYAHFAFWRWVGEEEALLCAWRGSPPEMTGPEPVMLRRGEFGWRIEPL